MNESFVSIIIPAKNAQVPIKKCLDSILNLNYKNYEVIVVNDGSTDDTSKILLGYPNIKILTARGEGPSKARNIAISQANGELIAFTDADCLVGSEWLTELLKGFISEDIVGVGGIQRSPADDSWFGKKVHAFLTSLGFVSGYMQPGQKIRPTEHNPTCNVIYRKSTLIELGGFLEGLWPGEDVELDYRIKKAGYLLAFNPGAVVYHYRPGNFKDFNKMMFRYGKAQGWLVKKYGVFRPIHFVPILIPILAVLFFYNTFFGFLVLSLIIVSIFIKLSLKSKNPFLILSLFFITIFSWNTGFVYGIFKKYN